MSSTYYLEVVFPAALEDVFKVLVSMKRSLDNYKLKEDANSKWILEREEMIARIMHFIDSSKDTFNVLQADNQQAYKQGFLRGKEQAEKDYQHKERYGDLSFANPKDKERLRAASIFNAQTKWNF